MSISHKRVVLCSFYVSSFHWIFQCDPIDHPNISHMHQAYSILILYFSTYPLERDTIVILEEWNQTYPGCPKCDMFVSHKALNGWHLTEAFLCLEDKRKRRRLAEEQARAGAEVAIAAYGTPLDPDTSFRYLWRFLSEADYEWTLVVSNLCIAQNKWASLTRVLIREGADERNSVQIYLAVAQLDIMYGSESWVMTQPIESVLG